MSNTPKVLVYIWDSYGWENNISAFKRLGFECEILDARGKLLHSAEYYDYMNRFLETRKFDLVFSTNYFGHLSEACYKKGIPYIAWTCDSPVKIDNIESLKHNTTFVFMFDSSEVYKYRTRYELKNIFYLPLAVDTEKYDSIICTDEDKKKFSAQISFVGRLYDNNLEKYLNSLNDYKKGFFNGIIDFNIGRYDSYGIEDIFSRNISEWINDEEFINAVYEGETHVKDIDERMISKEINAIIPRIGMRVNETVTNRERLLLLSMFSNHWDVKLFSDSTHLVLKNVTECGKVDYKTEMPKVFKCSDINLNVTFKNIKHGIPLRCLDIMGCRGFLLSNHQKDFDEDFEDGYNIAFYNSLDEAYDKCDYYLSHDTERKKVAEQGFITVKERYSYEGLLRQAFKKAGLTQFANI